jgi:hypothetical protein
MASLRSDLTFIVDAARHISAAAAGEAQNRPRKVYVRAARCGFI